MQTLLKRIEEFNGNLPLERAKTLPSWWYFDEEVYQLEREYFLKTWQYVGRRDQLFKPGDYFTCEVSEEPISVVSDEKQHWRAFYNVCRHKGAQVLLGCGNSSSMRCPYHGWTYDLQGRLRGMPEFGGVEEFCKETNGLRPLRVEGKGPLVFVTDGCHYPLEELFHALSLPTTYQFYSRKIYDLKCNWKVFVDNYLDGGYHVNYVHPSLAGVLDYKEYHTKLHKWSNVQISPLKKDGGIDDVRSGDAAYYWWLFPNLMINVYEKTFDTNLVIPTGVETCRVFIDFFFDETTSGDWADRSVLVCDGIQQEDISICENVQKGLRSRSYYDGRFSVRREAGGYHFHQLWASQLSQLLHEKSR